MKYIKLLVICITFILLIHQASLQDKKQDDDKEFQKKIDEAIKKGVEFLKKQQRDNGGIVSFFDSPKGQTALALYALVKSGIDSEDNVIEKGVDFILQKPLVPEMKGAWCKEIYDVSLMIMALEAIDSKKYKKEIEELAKFSLKRQVKSGAWGYRSAPEGDTSMSQYAILGLWAAPRAGIKIPSNIWENALKWFIKVQRKDGGWICHEFDSDKEFIDYDMSVAGIGSILICINELKKETKGARDAIEKGFRWLEKNWSIEPNPKVCGDCGFSYYYYLYGLERVGALSKKKVIGKHDWYKEGAGYILRYQDKDGRWLPPEIKLEDARKLSYVPSWPVVDTSFALLFLSRATKGLIETPSSKPEKTPKGIPTK